MRYLDVPVKYDIGLLLISVYGCVNSLVTILFVTPYRRFTFDSLIRPCMHKTFNLVHLKSPVVFNEVVTVNSGPSSLVQRHHFKGGVERRQTVF
jgi:hypothetical protein